MEITGRSTTRNPAGREGPLRGSATRATRRAAALAAAFAFGLGLAAPLHAQSSSIFGGALDGLSSSSNVASSDDGRRDGDDANRAYRDGDDIVIPAGTQFEVRTTQRLSSDDSRVGERFTGILESDIVAEGRVVVRRGARLTGEVTAAGKRRIDGEERNVIAVQPVEMEVNGMRLPVDARVTRAVTEEESNRSTLGDVAIVGGGVAAGALLGGLIGNGTSATLIGAALGGVAGTVVMATTKNHEAVMPENSVMTVRLERSLRIPDAALASR
ncbi:MAG: hypothetical protein RRA92_10730 [Gemmatimonadota bacterium]|nr:hypothetical protein [Gemmatimonadota bacterium]